MRLITRETNAANAYSEWMKTYPNDKDDIGKKIKKLGKTPNPDDVDSIIGNDSWTCVYGCLECGKAQTEVVEFVDLDEDSNNAFICKACLKKALAI